MDAKDRDEMLIAFGATLGKAWEDPMANFEAYAELRTKYEAQVRGEFEVQGLRKPWATWQAFWRRVFPLAAPRNSVEFLDLLYAVTTPVDAEFQRHRKERMDDDGNNFIEIVGTTGSGKSTVGLGIADEDAPIDPAQLENHVAFDQAKVPQKLAGLQRGQYLVLDEQTRLSGEGSKTAADELANIEDQFRASGKNMIVISPTQRDHQTVQLRLKTFAWSKDRQKTCLLLYADDVPLGFITRPFSRAELWTAYTPLKKAQVERSESAKFGDAADLARIVNETVADPRCVAFLTAGGKPKRKEFETALGMYYGRGIPTRKMSKVVGIFERTCYNWERYKTGLFKEQYGLDPHENFASVAKACYKER